MQIEKLRDYCLNENHPRGKHKAKVFKSALDIDSSKAETLRAFILDLIKEADAEEDFRDSFGIRYIADVVISIKDKSSKVRTHWIIKRDESFPRLITCYIKNN